MYFHYAAVVGGAVRWKKNLVMVLNDLQGIRNARPVKKYRCPPGVLSHLLRKSMANLCSCPSTRYHPAQLAASMVIKNVGEAFCRPMSRNTAWNIPFRFFIIPTGPSKALILVISKFIDAALANKDITIYGDGLQNTNLLLYKGHIDACISAMENPVFINDVVNIGNDDAFTILDLAQVIIKVTVGLPGRSPAAAAGRR